jgi:hypothetical protein
MRLVLHAADGAGGPVHLSLKPDTLVAAWPDGSVHTWDAAGRWLGGVVDGRQWLRSLDHRFVAARRGAPLERVKHPQDIEQVLARMRSTLEGLLIALARRARVLVPQDCRTEARLATRLAMAGRMCRDLVGDAERFRSLYSGEIAVVPGDLRRALYLQLMTGCPWNRCRFCTLYADARFGPRSLAQTQQHLQDVLAWYGPALGLRRTLFLGDADVLDAGGAHVLAQLRLIRESLGPELPADGFATVRSLAAWSVRELESLGRLGMRRLYLGLETGSRGLFRLLLRRDPLAMLGPQVARLHDAGLSVGLTVVVGLGGERWAEEHLAATVAFLEGLDLSAQDQVSLSPLVIEPGSPYSLWARAGDRIPLDPVALRAQTQAFEAALRPLTAAGGPRVAPYAIDLPPG